MTKEQQIVKGETYNSLTYTGNIVYINNKKWFEFQCACGRIKYWKGISTIRNGRIKSCGCKQNESKNELKAGTIFGYLTLTGNFDIRKIKGHHRKYFECECICGKIHYTREKNLIDGFAKSCGCKKSEGTAKGHTTHGLSKGLNKHPLYSIWNAIKQRCSNPNYRNYKYWGGRGVKVCDEWLNDFLKFYEWALANGWEKGLQLDKDKLSPNKTGDLYCPEYCCFLNRAEQARNRSDNVLITAFGETKCVMDWSRDSRCSIAWTSLKNRIFKWNWEIEKAIITPRLHEGNKKKKCANG